MERCGLRSLSGVGGRLFEGVKIGEKVAAEIRVQKFPRIVRILQRIP